MDLTLPPFKSLQDGDRLTLTGIVEWDTSHPHPALFNLRLSNGEVYSIGSDDYHAATVKVERATWTEVTA